MSRYKLKSIARRGSLLGTVAALVAATVIPAAPAFADALNPLTERSLTLSSSSPGWSYTDGSGNTTYAPPNSGANGQKTGNYFDFKVSSAATVKTMSFQYCTTSAGACETPGNDATPGTDSVSLQQADLNANFPGTSTDLEVPSGSFGTVIDSATGKVKAVPGYVNNNPKYTGSPVDPAEAATAVTGNYIVMTESGGTWSQSSGWLISAHTVNTGPQNATKNYIVLTKTAGVALTAGQQVKVLFFANGTNYITNPGQGAFFVKINTYGVEYAASPTPPQVNLSGLAPVIDTNIIDGGVTVANVMNQSIQITTKVLETMEFSVGTVDPNTLTKSELQASDFGSDTHIPCGRILTRLTPAEDRNVLRLGNQSSESALETGKAYATHSYWRLSSNSSGGASVYYSGHTLANTSGDEIKAIGTTAQASAPGSEQFGLAMATRALAGDFTFNTANYGVNYIQDRATGKNWENAADNGKIGVHNSQLLDIGATHADTPATFVDTTDTDWNFTPMNMSYHTPRLDPLAPTGNSGTGLHYYGGGSGRINGNDSLDMNGLPAVDVNDDPTPGYDTTNARFAFNTMSDTVPALIASEAGQVVDCVTAKMRYIGNIAATTPAGIYTTKINYIAAPQY